MRVYAVRPKYDRKCVGLFVVRQLSELDLLVDEFINPDDIEYAPANGARAVWPGPGQVYSEAMHMIPEKAWKPLYGKREEEVIREAAE